MESKHSNNKELDELQQGALRVGHVNVTEVNGQRIPTVLIDPATRPDFADLFRLHGQEPDGGDIECSWGMIGSIDPDDFEVFLRITFHRPANCEIKLRFELKNRNHVLALNSVEQTGLLALHSALPEPIGMTAEDGVLTPSLFVECSHDVELKELLSIHRTMLTIRRMLLPAGVD